MDNNELKFNELLFNYKKYECGQFVKYLLDNKLISIVELYEKYFTNSLWKVGKNIDNIQSRIWEEHIITSIVTYLVELTYDYIHENKMSDIGLKVLVVCPLMELHEVGAKMIAYLFEYAGFECVYIGANTPNDEIINALTVQNSDVIAISISSKYNLINLKKLVDEIINNNSSIKVIVGGSATNLDEVKYKIKNVMFANTFDDILGIRGDYNV